jgi:AcrR family transcriptional regulator
VSAAVEHVPAARATPVQDRGRARVASILRATGELLDEGGLERLTMEAVAQRAGTSIGTLYRYFPNRDALLIALGEHLGAVGLVQLSTLHDEEKARWSARDKAAEYVREYQRYVEEHPGALGLVTARGSLAPEVARRVSMETRWLGDVEEFLGRWAPGLAPDELRAAAVMLLRTSGLAMAVAFEVTGRARRRRLDEAERLLAAYLDALRRPPG